MKRLWRHSFAAAVAVTAGGVVLAVVGYLAEKYRLSIVGIASVWAGRFMAAQKSGAALSARLKRLRTYLFLKQLPIQFAIRMLALAIMTGAWVGDRVLAELTTLAMIAHLAACYAGPALFDGAFRATLLGRNLPKSGMATSVVSFNASDASWRKKIKGWRSATNWFEPALYVVLIAGGVDAVDTATWVAATWVAASGFNLAVLVLTTARTVKSQFYQRKFNETLESIAKFEPTFLVYFSAGGKQSLYQIRQWMPFLKSSGHRLLVVTRERPLLPGLARLSKKSPVVWVKRLVDLEKLVLPSVRGAIYVNNGMKNAHLLRFNSITHIQLLHGESDKSSSASKATRAYDVIAVAGTEAIERYASSGIAIPDSQFRIIGRPSTDRIDRAAPDASIQTLLCAPTWEGHDPANDYCSVHDIAEPSITWILEHNPELRIVFKPHPLTGTVDSSLATKLKGLKEKLNEANLEQGRSGVDAHRYITKGDIVDAFNECDALLCDISAVPADFLRSEKPMFVTDVHSLGQASLWAEFPTTRGSYVVDASAESWLRAAVAFESDKLSSVRAETRRRVLGDFEGMATDQLHQLLDDVAGFRPRPGRKLG